MNRSEASILLVDDRPENLVALQAVLEPLGHRLVLAGSGQEALRHVLDEEFALILMDVQMPGLDGFETASHIKSRERSKHIPIIFITALSNEAHHVFRGYQVGAADYLLKPFDATALMAKVEVFVDLYLLRHEADRMAHRALHDPLTSLPNRVLFVDRLELGLARLARRSSYLAVLFLDLDGFKLANDRLGHEAGDRLLCEVAQRLQNVLRPSDTVARLGGDEFTVLSEDISGEEEASQIAGRIQRAMAPPFQLREGVVTLSVSVGIALADESTRDPESLVREADVAMYRAKQAGGGRCELFDRDMRVRMAQRADDEMALRRALEHGELVLHYQPKVRLDTEAIVGIEALVRWHHPDRGLLSLGDFMPLAEESGLIVPLGTWVLGEALRQARIWRDQNPDVPAPVMAVNVSPRQLCQPDFALIVEEMLRASQTDPGELNLEIPEIAVTGASETMVRTLEALNQVRVNLSIDDFGTGYSSFKNLGRYPLDVISVDRSFVAALGTENDSAPVVEALIKLAHAFGLTAIAQGVESTEQLELLRQLGCDSAQGYHFGEPQPAELIGRLISAGRGALRTLEPAGLSPSPDRSAA